MKTLVIHPFDPTTKFLCPIYANKNWTIINDPYYKKKLLIEEIISHDKIIMMGHGHPDGLFNSKNWNHNIIEDIHVEYLRKKECVFIWCNAHKFVEKWGLKGFFTGMIISEPWEASWYAMKLKDNHIDDSNKLFARCIKKSIDKEPDKIVKYMKNRYKDKNNPVINFNSNNLFSITI